MASAIDNGKRGVIFSGMRPTGLLHLGNYVGRPAELGGPAAGL